MAVARITVAVTEDTRLRSEAFRSSWTGEPVGWLEVGEFELGLYGSPAALRRLALDAVRAAEDAEELGRCEPVRSAA
jgi:hypothetical protein